MLIRGDFRQKMGRDCCIIIFCVISRKGIRNGKEGGMGRKGENEEREGEKEATIDEYEKDR